MRLACYPSFTRNATQVVLLGKLLSLDYVKSIIILLMRGGVKQSTWGSVRTWESPHSTVAGECCDSAEEQNPQVSVINSNLTWKSKQWQRKVGLKVCVGSGYHGSFLHRMGTPPESLEDLLASTFCLISCSLLSFFFPFTYANKDHSKDWTKDLMTLYYPIWEEEEMKTSPHKACPFVYQNTHGFAAGFCWMTESLRMTVLSVWWDGAWRGYCRGAPCKGPDGILPLPGSLAAGAHSQLCNSAAEGYPSSRSCWGGQEAPRQHCEEPSSGWTLFSWESHVLLLCNHAHADPDLDPHL